MVVPPEPRQRVTRLTPLDEVLVAIDALAQPVLPRDFPVTAALGRVLAAAVTVARPAPAHPLSLRDGWAVRAELVADAGSYAPVPLMPAPEWVEIGQPLPAGADAVMTPDAVVIRAGLAEAFVPAVAGEGVLAAGADGAPGQPLRGAGQMLRAADLAVMEGLGIVSVRLRVPRVRLVASPRGEAGHATTALIRHAIEADGGAVSGHDSSRDDEDLADALVADGADAVIVVGGVGMGRHEHAVSTLARVGSVAFHGLGLKPGDSAAIGSVGARPALLLPGRLDAALAVYLVVGRRLLARLTGRFSADDAVPPGKAMLARKIVSTVGMAEVVLVRWRPGGAEHGGAHGAGHRIEPIASDNFPLQAITQADGYVLVPAASEGYAAGSVVEMRPLP